MSSNSALELLQQAHEEELISQASMAALNVPDLGQQIQNALGTPADDVQSSEVILVTMMIDDSGSIRFAGNSQVVIDGHNLVLQALKDSKQGDDIMLHTRYLNGHVLFPYSEIESPNVVHMDSSNYNPYEGTPLYDQSVVLLGTVLAKTQEFEKAGIAVRSCTLIMTDGLDEHSEKASAATVKRLVDDLLVTENHIVAAMGIQNDYVDKRFPNGGFKQIFGEMGIRDEWILTPGNSPSEIRKAFNVFSKSVSTASQTAQSFSQMAGFGGFGNDDD